MRLAHVALWTRDLEAAAAFWLDHFDAEVGPLYRSRRRDGFTSRFVTLPGDGTQIELMSGPFVADAVAADSLGWAHVAIAVGGPAEVDAFAARFGALGLLESGPRWTGDGFYETVVQTPDGTLIEVTM